MEQTDQRTDEQTPDLRCFAISSVNAVSVTSRLNQLSSNDSALVRAAQYCDEHVCLSVCLSAREHISGTTCPMFAKILCDLPRTTAASCGGVVIRYVQHLRFYGVYGRRHVWLVLGNAKSRILKATQQEATSVPGRSLPSDVYGCFSARSAACIWHVVYECRPTCKEDQLYSLTTDSALRSLLILYCKTLSVGEPFRSISRAKQNHEIKRRQYRSSTLLDNFDVDKLWLDRH